MFLALSIRHGHWARSVVAVIMSSTGMLALLACTLEQRTIGEVFDITTVPWSLAIGNTFMLTAVAAIAALSWRKHPPSQLPNKVWFVACYALGCAAGSWFHDVDGANYVRLGADAMVNAPTTLAHNIVAIPVLLGALLHAAVPVLRRKGWHRWAMISCLIVWAALVVIDTQRGLDPWSLHVEWDVDTFSPLK